METNSYQYDKTVPWIPQQNQLYEGSYVTGHSGQQRLPVLPNQRPQQRTGEQKPKPPKPMPKARALALTRIFKKWLVVASIIGFGTFSGLAAYHQVGTTASQTSSKSSQTTSTTTSSSQNSNSFFKQKGENNVGTSNSSNGSSTSSQAPVSGSSVS